MCEKEAEGHPNAPQLSIVVRIAAQGCEFFHAASATISQGKFEECARAAGGAPLGGVAFAGSVGVGDEVGRQDLRQLASPKGEGKALLSFGALARAAERGGSEEGWVGRVVGVARCLPSGGGRGDSSG